MAKPWLRLASFDTAFQNAERLWYKPPQPVTIPELLDMPVAEFARQDIAGTYTVPEDFVAIAENALVCPVNSVVVTDSREIVRESLSTAPYEVKRFPIRERAVPGYAVLWRSRKDGYYHTLVENLPRLLALRALPTSDFPEIRLLCPEPLTEIESFFLSVFCPENVLVTPIEKNRMYRIERLIFTPFKTRRYAGYLPGPYVEHIRNGVLPDRPSRRSHRLFISRERASRRRISNQKQLESLLSRFDFEPVVLEDLPIEKQIELFYDAETIIGPHGAGFANTLFAESCNIVELFPSKYVIPHYFYLSKAVGHTYAYWCGRGEDHHSDFEVDAESVRALLTRVISLEHTSSRRVLDEPCPRPRH